MKKVDLYQYDKMRGGALPLYQYFLRKANTPSRLLAFINNVLLRFFSFLYKVEISSKTKIGKGLYIGHPYCITINPNAALGDNINIDQGVTRGQENRGVRKGVPKIGNCVWIGVNATIVGKINIGDDVLIAPNTYVNCDIPSHSIVFGNPCIIKHRDNATEGYVNKKV